MVAASGSGAGANLDPRSRDNTLVLSASAGLYTTLDEPHGRVPVGSKYKIGKIASDRRPHLTNDVLNDPNVGDPQWARAEGITAFAGYSADRGRSRGGSDGHVCPRIDARRR